MTYHHIKGKTIQTDQITADEAREENRARQLLYCQYMYQPVAAFNGLSPIHLQPIVLGKISNDNGMFLLLRDVSTLTDEELIAIALLCGWDKKRKTVSELIAIGRACISGFQDYFVPLSVWQYLLAIGILLPFTYLDKNNKPVTTPASDILLLEWAKIKEKI